MADSHSIQLVERVRQGDERAAAELFDDYVQRLLALARSQLSPGLARRIDPDDVVQSVFRTFFHRAQQGQFTLREGGDLWRLLTAITINKVRGQAKRHGVQKRAIAAEAGLVDGNGLFGLTPEAVAADPSPSEAMALREEIQWALDQLPQDQRILVVRRMEGMPFAQIAETCDCSERKVYRARDRFKEILRERLVEQSRG